MNKFELHELAQQLVDQNTSYKLAKALISAVQSELSLLDNGCGNNLDFTYHLNKHLKVNSNEE